MKRILSSATLVAAFGLCGCGSLDNMEGPIVDMRGVDQTRYNNDLAQCQDKKRDMGPVTFGAPISSCMEERGYKVISRRS